MEPLAAFGIVCNVMQVIDFSHNLFLQCKELYDTGQENPSLELNAKSLADLSDRLVDSLEAEWADEASKIEATKTEAKNEATKTTKNEATKTEATKTGATKIEVTKTTEAAKATKTTEAIKTETKTAKVTTKNEAEIELEQVAKRCIRATDAFAAELEKLAAAKPKGRVGRAMRGVFKRWQWTPARQLQRHEDEMRELQNILENGLLSRICPISDALALQNGAGFEKLDRRLQRLIASVATQKEEQQADKQETQADVKDTQPKDTVDTQQNEAKQKETQKDTQKETPQKATLQKPTSPKTTLQKLTPQKLTSQKSTPQKMTPQKATPQKATPQKPILKTTQKAAQKAAQKATPQKGAPEAVQKSEKEVKWEAFASRDESARSRLQGSFEYRDMYERRNEIDPKRENTFQCIYEDHITSHRGYMDGWDGLSERSISPLGYDLSITTSHGSGSIRTPTRRLPEAPLALRNDFPDWLQSPAEIFWISGKPGTGKSSLMHFLTREQRTRDILNGWHAKPQILHYFVHISGGPMQRNLRGLLCSLLNQLLDDDRHLMAALVRKHPSSLAKDKPDDWALPELKAFFFDAFEIKKRGTCVFLDGLDEMDPSEDMDETLTILQKLASFPRVKLCVSSRPEPTISKRLAQCPKLTLEALTDIDIRRFVREFLQPYFSPGANQRNDAQIREGSIFIEKICEKADGVFLWVHLVLRSLRRGLNNKDSISLLNQRLDQLPRRLFDLFEELWGSLAQDVHMLTAARYFKLFLAVEEYGVAANLSVADVMFATSDEAVKTCIWDRDGVTPSIITEKCESVVNFIDTRCAGLLEYTQEPPRHDHIDSPYRDCSRFATLRVHFVHRTARDYLLYTEQGRHILGRDPSTSEDGICRIFRAWLAVGSLWDNYHSVNPWTIYRTGLEHLRRLAQLRRLLAPDRTMLLLFLIGYFFTKNAAGRLPYYPNAEAPAHLPPAARKCPDFITLLAHSGLWDLMPRFLEFISGSVTRAYVGHVVMCSTSRLVRRSMTQENAALLDATVRAAANHKADLNIRGLSYIDVQQAFRPDSTPDEIVASLKGLYGERRSSVARLVSRLLNPKLELAQGRNEGPTILRMVSTLLDQRVSLDEANVFSIYERDDKIQLNPLSPAFPISTDNGWTIIFSTTPLTMLKMALNATKKADGTTTKEEPDVVLKLRKRTDSSSAENNPPTILAFSPRALKCPGSWAETELYRPIKTWHKMTMQKLLVDLLEHFTRGALTKDVERCARPLWTYFDSIVDECESTSEEEMQAELVRKGSLVSVADYLGAVPRLSDAQEAVLSKGLGEEALRIWGRDGDET